MSKNSTNLILHSVNDFYLIFTQISIDFLKSLSDMKMKHRERERERERERKRERKRERERLHNGYKWVTAK